MSLTAFVIGVAGWFIRWGIHAHVSNPGFVVRTIENGFAVLLLGTVWGLAVGMMPLRFFPGDRVRGWSRAGWLALWIVGIAFAIHVLLSDYGVSQSAWERPPPPDRGGGGRPGDRVRVLGPIRAPRRLASGGPGDARRRRTRRSTPER